MSQRSWCNVEISEYIVCNVDYVFFIFKVRFYINKCVFVKTGLTVWPFQSVISGFVLPFFANW